MAKTEDFRVTRGADAATGEDHSKDAHGALLDAAFSRPSVTRTGDQRGGVSGGYGWQPVNPETWPKPRGAESPTGPNPVQWHGGRPDVSRGPGGTVWQPRPTDHLPTGTQVVRPGEGPSIAPIVVPATRDQTGKWVGPTILPDSPPAHVAPPPERNGRGGLVEGPDGKLVDTRSEREKAGVEMDLAGFIGGAFIGFMKGGMKGGIAGGIIGVVAAELLKPLNPFHK